MTEEHRDDVRTAFRDRILDTLGGLTGDRRRYGLLDYPAHTNIGDSAIWAGSVEILRRLHGGPPSYVSHLRFSPDEVGRSLGEDDVIYLLGGGNFGDVWNRHQDYRNEIVRRYPRNRIVQLPQSIHFADPKGHEATRRAIAGHGDYHLMVRDRASYEFAREHFECPVLLTPDCAFGIDASGYRGAAPVTDVLALMRTDHERRPDAGTGQRLFDDPAWMRCDWVRASDPRQSRSRAEMGLHQALSLPALMAWRERRFTAMARQRIAMGFAQLGQGRVVVTDRLHGHIMSTLLGKPHVVIDNFYGKIRNFIDAFGPDGFTRIAGDYPEARRMAEEMLAGKAA